MKKLMKIALACVVGTLAAEYDRDGSAYGQTGPSPVPPMTAPNGAIVGQLENPNGSTTDEITNPRMDAIIRQLALLDWEIGMTNQYLASLRYDLESLRETLAAVVSRIKNASSADRLTQPFNDDVLALQRQIATLEELIAEQESRLIALLAEHDRLEWQLAELDTGGQRPLGIPVDG